MKNNEWGVNRVVKKGQLHNRLKAAFAMAGKTLTGTTGVQCPYLNMFLNKYGHGDIACNLHCCILYSPQSLILDTTPSGLIGAHKIKTGDTGLYLGLLQGLKQLG